MTKLLIKLFIKNKSCDETALRGKYATLAGAVGIIVNVLLFIGKLTVGLIAASVAITADAFNNISDAGSAIIALIGFRLASKPVDKEHPQGHGRLEYVAGFIVDMLIILVGFELFKTSITKIITPSIPNVGNITLIILGVAVFVKIWLFCFYRKIGVLIKSNALKASSADSLSDAITTTLVLVSSLVGRYAGIAVDGWAGILVALFILYTGIRASKETIDLLLGSPPDKAFIDSIYAFCDNKENYPNLVGIHDVMVHDYGPGRQIVSFHAEVPANSDINVAHEEIDQLERDMHARFGCIVTVHLDPIVVGDPLVDELKALTWACVKEIDESFTIHDFRMTKGETKINLIFDLLVPTDSKTALKEAEKKVAEKIREKNPDCSCVIRAEHPFV